MYNPEDERSAQFGMIDECSSHMNYNIPPPRLPISYLHTVPPTMSSLAMSVPPPSKPFYPRGAVFDPSYPPPPINHQTFTSYYNDLPSTSYEKAFRAFRECHGDPRNTEPERPKSRSRSIDGERKRDYDDYYRERRSDRHRRSHESRRRSRSRSKSTYYERDRERYSRDRYESRHHRYHRRHSPYHRDDRGHSRSSRRESSHRRSPSKRRHHSQSIDEYSKRSRLSVSRKKVEVKNHSSDRLRILEEYRKNYCSSSKDILKKMEEWSKEHNSDVEELENVWFRSSPAELYYKPLEGSEGVEQTGRLAEICETFRVRLIERGRNARPEADELPPLSTYPKLCSHSKNPDKYSDSDDSLDEEGLQGFNDRVMLELERKQKHPRRLHPEMWFNNPGEMNGGPLCRCSLKARRFGMRHGVYAGEQKFPPCIRNQSNIQKLFHYRITVSPPTNFLIKTPTIIAHDEHEFLFSGFSMFSHYKLSKLPKCKVIRFNIEYTILYVEEPAPQNFTIEELFLFEEYLFTELLELVDLDLGKASEDSCSQFHFMPRFVRNLADNGCEVLSMCEVLKYLLDQNKLLIEPDQLSKFHSMDHYVWQRFVDNIKGMIVTYPGKKPCSVRVDQLDKSPPSDCKDETYYPEIVHFGIRPPQLSYAGNPEYQKAWRHYVKYRHLVANMAKPSMIERQKLAAKEANLQKMRTLNKMKRDVTVAISSKGFYTTGLMCDVVQHAMLIPVLVRHLRFHKSLDNLEETIGYVFKSRSLLQTALTHPSYRENFGTNPDHARNSLTNCGIRQPEYGDRRIHYTRKKEGESSSDETAPQMTDYPLISTELNNYKNDDLTLYIKDTLTDNEDEPASGGGIVTLINIMSRFGKNSETESSMKHNERLEFLGDAVVEFLSSIHLFNMFPGLAEGGLATYRAAIVQNQHLADLAKNIGLEQFMLYAHGSDLCRDVVMRHAMANCFEALMGALFLDGGIEIADKVFAYALWFNEPDALEVWLRERPHPLQEQEPLGDRKYIKKFDFLKKLTNFENSIGVKFKHIRLLARAFTDRSVGFTHLTLGSNQRLEFLGDTVLQLVVSDKLYRHFPEHHEGHLSLLRSSLVNNRTQAMVCDDLGMAEYAVYNNPKSKPTTKKHKADLLEAFLGALYIDKNMEYCQVFCMLSLFPRLQEFILHQDWNDPKSKLQQCCLTLRSVEGGEPDIPVYKVIECLGPTNTRIYTVAVYFRGIRLAAARGHSIQEAEMQAAELALTSAHGLFPQLDHQRRVMSKEMNKKNSKESTKNGKIVLNANHIEEKVPLAYKHDGRARSESSDETSFYLSSEDEQNSSFSDKSDEETELSSEESVSSEVLPDVTVSTLLSDMEKMKEEMMKSDEYEKLKEKCRKIDSDDDSL